MSALSKRSVIKFYCGTCEQKLSVPAGLEGQKFSCPNCAAPGHVPGTPSHDLRLNGEAIIKFFCQHCGQKLSCEALAVGQSAKCPVCGESTLVPKRTKAGQLFRPKKPQARPLNGKPKEEPEVILGPDTERIDPSWTANGKKTASGDLDPKKGSSRLAGNGGSAPKSARKSSSTKTTLASNATKNGANGRSVAEEPALGSTSLEELFESLEDLGFEVEQLSGLRTGSNVARDSK